MTDGARVEDGTLVILDARTPRVYFFYASDGAPLAAYGNRGRGPGEFSHAIALDGSSDQVLVLDQGNLRISHLRLDGDTVALVGETRVPIPNPRDICVIGSRIFLMGLHEGFLIHEVDPSGAIVQSFGRPRPDDPTGGQLGSVGRLACDEASGRIATVSTLRNQVGVYTADGDHVLTDTIPKYLSQQFEFNETVMRPLPPSEGYYHKVEDLHWLPSGRLFIQLVRTRPKEAPPHEARILDPTDRSWSSGGPDYPHRVLILGSDFVVFTKETPYPMVAVYRER